MVQSFDGFKDSLWQATAVASPQLFPLKVNHIADVTIIGAGFVGLNAAIDLAEAGHSVVVLEARELGFGGSGRSGGQVNMDLNLGPSQLMDLYGKDQGQRTIAMTQATPQRLFDRVHQLGLNCDPVQNGWVQAAIDQRTFEGQKRLAEEYDRFGGGLDVLGERQIRDRSGTESYLGGLFCPSAGSIQPLSYTRELARVALTKGVKVYNHSPVASLRSNSDGWVAALDNGCEVKSGQVLVCTNGYTGNLVQGLKQKLVPIRSILIATEPLSRALQEEILPNQVTFVDKRRLILYMRYDRDGRLCIGDLGPMKDEFSLNDFEGVKKRAIKVFPALTKVKWSYHWGGRIAMTRSHLPFIYEPKAGLVAGLGCNGRGVGLGTVMGRNLAKLVSARLNNTQEPDLDLPLSHPKSYSFHSFHPLGAFIGTRWAGFLDQMEESRMRFKNRF